MKKNKIQVIEGHAKLKSKSTIEVKTKRPIQKKSKQAIS